MSENIMDLLGLKPLQNFIPSKKERKAPLTAPRTLKSVGWSNAPMWYKKAYEAYASLNPRKRVELPEDRAKFEGQIYTYYDAAQYGLLFKEDDWKEYDIQQCVEWLRRWI